MPEHPPRLFNSTRECVARPWSRTRIRNHRGFDQGRAAQTPGDLEHRPDKLRAARNARIDSSASSEVAN